MSTFYAYCFIGLMVALTTYGQMVLKWQVITQASKAQAPNGIWFYLSLLLNPWVLSAFAAAFAASFCWMAALSKLPISKAYPLSSLTFVIVVLGGAFLFSESLNGPKLIGLSLIVAGIIITSQG